MSLLVSTLSGKGSWRIPSEQKLSEAEGFGKLFEEGVLGSEHVSGCWVLACGPAELEFVVQGELCSTWYDRSGKNTCST